jgi:hypothetical protein
MKFLTYFCMNFCLLKDNKTIVVYFVFIFRPLSYTSILMPRFTTIFYGYMKHHQYYTIFRDVIDVEEGHR